MAETFWSLADDEDEVQFWLEVLHAREDAPERHPPYEEREGMALRVPWCTQASSSPSVLRS